MAYSERPDSAFALMRRTVTLSGNELWTLDQYTRILMVSRRYAAADSVIGRIESLYPIQGRAEAADLRSLLFRERGRPRAANRIVEALAAADPASAGFVELIRADNRRLLGDHAGAFRDWERLAHGGPTAQTSLPLEPGSARAFCWHHALAADASGPAADTIALRGIADTLERACTRSYYGRDWRLYHHVRGLVAMRAGRYDDAEREFKQAIWSRIEGWSRTAVELARARMAAGRPREAVEALRPAYATRLDAMGRYVPISELDFWMARAFAAAGEADSARVYDGYVDRAWRDAEPEVRKMLAMAGKVAGRP
jgi:tetratricopeptide (TPR) repeat protein